MFGWDRVQHVLVNVTLMIELNEVVTFRSRSDEPSAPMLIVTNRCRRRSCARERVKELPVEFLAEPADGNIARAVSAHLEPRHFIRNVAKQASVS